MLAPSQADDVPRAQGPLSHLRVTALPKESQGIVYWHKKWSVSVSIRSIHCFTATLNARAARKSDGRNGFRPGTLCPPCGRGGRAQRGRRGQITATSNRKMLAPSQADDVPRAQGLSVTCGDSSPKGEPRHRILAQEMERICIDTLHSLFYGYPLNARAARKSDGRKRFPSRHSPCLSLWERWPSAARTERANNGNVQSENAGTFAGR